MNKKAAIAFITACFAVSILNQGIIRYTWLQSTEGCAADLVEWVDTFHQRRMVTMVALVLQVGYAALIYSYLKTTSLGSKLGHVFISLVNVVLMSTQMGIKDLLQHAWGTCAEPFEDAYGHTDSCQALALLAFVVATMVGHAMPKSKKSPKTERYPMVVPPARPSAPPLAQMPPPEVPCREPRLSIFGRR